MSVQEKQIKVFSFLIIEAVINSNSIVYNKTIKEIKYMTENLSINELDILAKSA